MASLSSLTNDADSFIRTFFNGLLGPHSVPHLFLYSASRLLVRVTVMHGGAIRHRRGRRTDLADLLRLLARKEEEAPVPDRAMLRRFRRIVSDLGNDLYVALIGGRVAGFVQISYRRDITRGIRGRIEQLAVDPEDRPDEVIVSLAALAVERARRHRCYDLRYATAEISPEVSQTLAQAGWAPSGSELRREFQG